VLRLQSEPVCGPTTCVGGAESSRPASSHLLDACTEIPAIRPGPQQGRCAFPAHHVQPLRRKLLYFGGCRRSACKLPPGESGDAGGVPRTQTVLYGVTRSSVSYFRLLLLLQVLPQTRMILRRLFLANGRRTLSSADYLDTEDPLHEAASHLEASEMWTHVHGLMTLPARLA